MHKNIFLLGLLTLTFACKNTQSVTQKVQEIKQHDISMFPNAEEGFKRVFIQLEKLENEADFQIEIYAGKTVDTDCNKHTLMGEFVEENLSGWGYTYYNFDTNGEFRTTLMACPDNKRKLEFVKSPSKLIRYNSNLPIVIFVPKDYQIKYKIWERKPQEFEVNESES